MEISGKNCNFAHTRTFGDVLHYQNVRRRSPLIYCDGQDAFAPD